MVSPIFHAIEASPQSSLLGTRRPDVASISAMHLVSSDYNLCDSGRPPSPQLPVGHPVGHPPLVTPLADAGSNPNPIPPTGVPRTSGNITRDGHTSGTCRAVPLVVWAAELVAVSAPPLCTHVLGMGLVKALVVAILDVPRLRSVSSLVSLMLTNHLTITITQLLLAIKPLAAYWYQTLL